MSTSTRGVGTGGKATKPTVDEQSEQESGSEQGTTKEGEKEIVEAASVEENLQLPSVTYGQQAEEARRAYAQYYAQFGPNSQHLGTGPPHPPWPYPPPGAYYPPAYIPVAPDGTPLYPSFYAPFPPGARPLPGGPMIVAPSGVIPIAPNAQAPPEQPRVTSGLSVPQRPRTTVTDKIFIACSYCRHRKLRCSGDTPKCTVCVRYDQICNYDDHRRTRGPGRKSLVALGIDVPPSKKQPKKKAKEAATTSITSSSALLPPPPPTSNCQAVPTFPPPPFPASFSAGSPPDTGVSPQALEGSAITAAAILNALPTLQAALARQNIPPYPSLFRSVSGPPQSPTPSPHHSPQDHAESSVEDVEPKTTSPKAKKRRAKDESSSSPKKRKRGHKS
ncbi:hypothetical protein DACRYDRAFT_115582 [Dacryopinax primogenitus]|uniref:Zn(2)-C6 fungal-type domain-containing protein n=1 Tax=Dacryopinax primogenitus (strain DJM 731) TaxID=1858805 RepID=M5FX01_DACPD|nr:uncharacterized protein DACRYDRAFT_115582 [Dacryopinax primogenitus]EJU02521.1 hypothetical protein DACRYDRAFT_115582 [Dacryopinax primogenitus]